MPYVLTPVNRIAMIARHVDRTEGPFETASDRKEAIKCACAKLKVTYDSGMINQALDWIDDEALRKTRRHSLAAPSAPPIAGELAPEASEPPISRAEAAKLLREIDRKLGR